MRCVFSSSAYPRLLQQILVYHLAGRSNLVIARLLTVCIIVVCRQYLRGLPCLTAVWTCGQMDVISYLVRRCEVARLRTSSRILVRRQKSGDVVHIHTHGLGAHGNSYVLRRCYFWIYLLVHIMPGTLPVRLCNIPQSRASYTRTAYLYILVAVPGNADRSRYNCCCWCMRSLPHYWCYVAVSYLMTIHALTWTSSPHYVRRVFRDSEIRCNPRRDERFPVH